MNLHNRIVLIILVMLMLISSVALVAASDSASGRPSRSAAQTAVFTVLNQFAEPDCPPAGETFQQLDFDMAQPVPNCWLLTGTK